MNKGGAFNLFALSVICLGLMMPAFSWADRWDAPESVCPPPDDWFMNLPPEYRTQGASIDLKSYFEAYCGFIIGLTTDDKGRLFIITADGKQNVYDDGRLKTFKEKLADPDLEDALSLLYRPGPVLDEPPPDFDPGRFRVDELLKSVYGGSAKAVRKNSAQVKMAGKNLSFNQQNQAAAALKAVSAELKALITAKPKLKKYLNPLGGTFNWRVISGTTRLSPHSWAIAVDLNPKLGGYWRWGKKTPEQSLRARKKYPLEIVSIFEKHGFIWGGKWAHFDLMHFEYRPELLIKWRLSQAP